MKLNLGCGRLPLPGYVNVDNRHLPGVDEQADLEHKWPWPSESATFVRASHVYEHIDRPLHFMAELYRVLAPGAVALIIGPHWEHVNSAADPTHKRSLTPYSFEFWTGNNSYEQYGPVFTDCVVWETTDEVWAWLRK